MVSASTRPVLIVSFRLVLLMSGAGLSSCVVVEAWDKTHGSPARHRGAQVLVWLVVAFLCSFLVGFGPDRGRFGIDLMRV